MYSHFSTVKIKSFHQVSAHSSSYKVNLTMNECMNSNVKGKNSKINRRNAKNLYECQTFFLPIPFNSNFFAVHSPLLSLFGHFFHFWSFSSDCLLISFHFLYVFGPLFQFMILFYPFRIPFTHFQTFSTNPFSSKFLSPLAIFGSFKPMNTEKKIFEIEIDQKGFRNQN